MDPALQIPHLLRRTGFGATPQELDSYRALGFAGAVDRLLNYELIDNSHVSTLPNIRQSYSAKAVGNELRTLAEWWLDRIVRTARPLEEKMTLFWHNHFATGFFKVQNGYLMYKQNEFLRSNALGNFRDILMGITSDGAMLVWLDGNRNRKKNPNENYAREVMEVFSTGRGPYTQDDVVAGARALTGYSIDSNGNGVFNPSQHDTGVKTFLGLTGNLGPSDIIDILVARPETAANLSRELFEFFAYPNPSTDTISRLSKVYFDSVYSIRALVEAILKSDEFVSQQAYLANVKSPVEYVATALRSLGATSRSPADTESMNFQGQLLFDPPSVFGWPSGLSWINTGSMMERFNFPLLVQTTKEDSSSKLDPSVIFGNGASEASAVDALANTLFPEGLPSQVLQVIESSTASISYPVAKTKNVVRLTMASPYYNLN
jgi:uncharacterized protein (DUF1800 family)